MVMQEKILQGRMLYLRLKDLEKYPDLRDSMHTDRAYQFHVRHGWPVTLDENGMEFDQYDAIDPLYVIWETADGHHGGSFRLLPTTGRTMAAEIFPSLLPVGGLCDPQIWECTRFCLSRNRPSSVSAALMLAGAAFVRHNDIASVIGIFDSLMARVFRIIGTGPEVVGAMGEGRQRIEAGYWRLTEENWQSTLLKAGLSESDAKDLFADSATVDVSDLLRPMHLRKMA
ncbi:acyl-homoserine-lactone synthase [Loktanella sp. DJP18]|uniref:acyl-homoserine-lactone synthase n=1 Tax=Loktanella sp. DJP18 TaxID=3409788 RepID=UPI003BB65232